MSSSSSSTMITPPRNSSSSRSTPSAPRKRSLIPSFRKSTKNQSTLASPTTPTGSRRGLSSSLRRLPASLSESTAALFVHPPDVEEPEGEWKKQEMHSTEEQPGDPSGVDSLPLSSSPVRRSMIPSFTTRSSNNNNNKKSDNDKPHSSSPVKMSTPTRQTRPTSAGRRLPESLTASTTALFVEPLDLEGNEPLQNQKEKKSSMDPNKSVDPNQPQPQTTNNNNHDPPMSPSPSSPPGRMVRDESFGPMEEEGEGNPNNNSLSVMMMSPRPDDDTDDQASRSSDMSLSVRFRMTEERFDRRLSSFYHKTSNNSGLVPTKDGSAELMDSYYDDDDDDDVDKHDLDDLQRQLDKAAQEFMFLQDKDEEEPEKNNKNELPDEQPGVSHSDEPDSRQPLPETTNDPSSKTAVPFPRKASNGRIPSLTYSSASSSSFSVPPLSTITHVKQTSSKQLSGQVDKTADSGNSKDYWVIPVKSVGTGGDTGSTGGGDLSCHSDFTPEELDETNVLELELMEDEDDEPVELRDDQSIDMLRPPSTTPSDITNDNSVPHLVELGWVSKDNLDTNDNSVPHLAELGWVSMDNLDGSSSHVPEEPTTTTTTPDMEKNAPRRDDDPSETEPFSMSKLAAHSKKERHPTWFTRLPTSDTTAPSTDIQSSAQKPSNSMQSPDNLESVTQSPQDAVNELSTQAKQETDSLTQTPVNEKPINAVSAKSIGSLSLDENSNDTDDKGEQECNKAVSAKSIGSLSMDDVQENEQHEAEGSLEECTTTAVAARSMGALSMDDMDTSEEEDEEDAEEEASEEAASSESEPPPRTKPVRRYSGNIPTMETILESDDGEPSHESSSSDSDSDSTSGKQDKRPSSETPSSSSATLESSLFSLERSMRWNGIEDCGDFIDLEGPSKKSNRSIWFMAGLILAMSVLAVIVPVAHYYLQPAPYRKRFKRNSRMLVVDHGPTASRPQQQQAEQLETSKAKPASASASSTSSTAPADCTDEQVSSDRVQKETQYHTEQEEPETKTSSPLMSKVPVNDFETKDSETEVSEEERPHRRWTCQVLGRHRCPSWGK